MESVCLTLTCRANIVSKEISLSSWDTTEAIWINKDLHFYMDTFIKSAS